MSPIDPTTGRWIAEPAPLAQAAAPAAATASPAEPEPATAAPLSLADAYADWPVKGPRGDDAIPHPWEDQTLIKQGLDHEDDSTRPIVVREGLPMLTSGSQDPRVIDYGRALGRIGYANSVSQGTNPYGLVDESVLTATQAFRRDYGVAEDPRQFVADPQDGPKSHIGPYTQEAVLRVDQRGA